jgi:hypothetical protein
MKMPIIAATDCNTDIGDVIEKMNVVYSLFQDLNKIFTL